MLERTWNRETVVDLVILLCGILLAIGPLLFDLDGAPAWNARFGAVVILLSALADFTTRPQWSSRVDVVLGGWLIFAPWVLNFSDQAATDFHLVIGAAVLALAAAKLLGRHGHPPWLYEPGAAARAAWLRQPPPETEPGVAPTSQRNVWAGLAHRKYSGPMPTRETGRRHAGGRRTSSARARASIPHLGGARQPPLFPRTRGAALG
jgi:hypothetical protein